MNTQILYFFGKLTRSGSPDPCDRDHQWGCPWSDDSPPQPGVCHAARFIALRLPPARRLGRSADARGGASFPIWSFWRWPRCRPSCPVASLPWTVAVGPLSLRLMTVTMPATSPSQEVAGRLLGDGYVVVTGLMPPDGVRDARSDLGPAAARHPDRAELLRGFPHAADLRAVRQDPRVRRGRHPPAAARGARPGAGPLPAQRAGRHLRRAG